MSRGDSGDIYISIEDDTMSDTTRIAPILEPVYGNDGKQKFTDAPFYSHMTAILRLPNDRAFINPLEGWRPYTAEESRKVTRHTASDPRKTDADVKLAQLYRITGLKGTAVLSRADYRTGQKGEGRMVTARGRPTANVPSHLSGLEPNASMAVHQASDGSDMTVTGSEIRFLKRYRESMRGTAYAAAMQHEQAERTLAYWRSAFPWIPCDSHGKLWEGKRYNRADGIGERIYSDGSMLSERKREYDAAQQEAQSATERDAEIARLKAESDAETRATRTARVRKAIESERKPLRF